MGLGTSRLAAARGKAKVSFRVVTWLLLAAVGVFVVNAVVGFGSLKFTEDLHSNLFAAISILGAITVLARAALVRQNRLGWTLFGLGLTGLAGGDLYYNIVLFDLEVAPFPSPADFFYLGGTVLLVPGLFFLLRSRLQRPPASLWLDAAIGVLAVIAIGLGLLLGTIQDTSSGTTLQIAISAAYPLADLGLFAMIAAVVALSGARLDRSLVLVMAGMTALMIGDLNYFYQSAAGTYIEGSVLDALWPLSVALMATAAWIPSKIARIVPATGMRALIVPSGFALAVVIFDFLTPWGRVPEALGSLVLVLLVIRMVVGIAENQGLLRRLGLDPLTQLGTRGRLAADLSRAIAFGRPHTLVLADLDGFKLYNDAFGHPAGDAMLSRLGRGLGAAVKPRGQAYRVGGDEFCVLIEGSGGATDNALADIKAALTEAGKGFSVGVSLGAVQIPDECHEVEPAIQLADQRMYASKDSRRSESRQRDALSVLINAQREREPELDDHVSMVADLAGKVGKSLGLLPGEVSVLKRAAELHDIGKIAIPDAILEKAGPLTDDEWEFMHQHTVLGERILASADSLAPYAQIVRSSHERMDGEGYPDRLSGDEIPLAARIVFACDAYSAMISDRPYANARTPAEAMTELKKCAGTQFDPGVVDAIAEVLAAEVPKVATNGTVSAARRSLLPATA